VVHHAHLAAVLANGDLQSGFTWVHEATVMPFGVHMLQCFETTNLAPFSNDIMALVREPMQCLLAWLMVLLELLLWVLVFALLMSCHIELTESIRDATIVVHPHVCQLGSELCQKVLPLPNSFSVEAFPLHL